MDDVTGCPECNAPRFRFERGICRGCSRAIEARMLWLMGPTQLVNAADRSVVDVPGLGGVWVGKHARPRG